MTSQEHMVRQGRVKVGSGANVRSKSFLDISSKLGAVFFSVIQTKSDSMKMKRL